MTDDYRSVVIGPDTPIVEAIGVIDRGGMQIALVSDAEGQLLGTVTDGDIRRGILGSVGLNEPVARVMNVRPTTATPEMSRDQILATMRERQIHQIPVVDRANILLGIELLDAMLRGQILDNWVVLMAGGLGSRLRPLTDDTPKPLLPIGGRPLLEIILESLIDQGFRRFFISVNYKAEMFKTLFGDGSRLGVEIGYIDEPSKLGTAGALGLLPEQPHRPIIVMNGDLLTSVNFRQLLQAHAEHRAVATMCVREYSYQVPFGVARTEQHRLLAIEEKPVQTCFVSGGIYVLDPVVLERVPPARALDMPDLFKGLIADGQQVTAFPVHEYWLDIGQAADLERARWEYDGVFTR